MVTIDGSKQLADGELAGEESLDLQDAYVQLPMLEMGDEGMESRQSRRRAIHRLDDLLDQLERANLCDLSRPPAGAVREFMTHGLTNPFDYTLHELIEIVFKAQAALMRANRSGDEIHASLESYGWHDSRDASSVA